MYDEYLDSHKKDFGTECLQIKYWDQCLEYIYSQIAMLDELSKIEEETSNAKGNYIAQLSNEYYISCQKVSGEPSNIFYLSQIILDCYIKEITITRTQLSKFNFDLGNSIQDILKGIAYVKEKIIQLSHKTMTEVTGLMHSSMITQTKFTKSKAALDEAQMNKKRLEQNARYAYNITMKTQADQKVLDRVQEMEAIIPSIKALAKDLKEKKQEFNLIMKDNFEIVILNTFKHLFNLHQCFFLMAKVRFDISSEIKTVLHDAFNLLTTFTVNINDFTEKKFAALQGIKFDSIEMINLQDEYTKSNATQLLNASNSVINYVNIFYTCIKMRRALMKRSLKYFSQYKAFDKQAKDEFEKKQKKFSDYINEVTIIGNGTANSWKKLFSSFNIISMSQDKALIMNNLTEYIIQSKKDYSELKTKWSKIEAKLMRKRNAIEEININMRKKLKETGRLKPRQIEEKINNQMIKKTPRFIEVINYAIDFIKTYIGSLRDQDIKRCTKMIETFTAIIKGAEELYERRNELIQNEIDHCTQIDLFEECVGIFKPYFNKFNITNYESFLEKIKMKVLIQSDFHKGKLGQNAMNKMNELNTSLMIHNNTTAQLKSIIKTKKVVNENKMISNLNENCSGNDDEENLIFNKELEQEFEFNKENFFSSSDDGFNSNNINNYNNRKSSIFPEIELNNNLEEERKNTEQSQICFNERGDKKILSLNHKKDPLTPSNKLQLVHIGNTHQSNNNAMVNANCNQNANVNDNTSKSKSSQKEMTKTNNNTLLNLDEEKLDFVNQKNFDIIDHQSPYQNFKGQEIEEYKNRLEDRMPSINQQDAFQLEEGEEIQNNFYCAYASRILRQGKLYVTSKKLIFDSVFNASTVIGKGGAKLFIPLRDITKIVKTTHLLIFDNSIEIHTSKAVLFFTSFINRDHCAQLINMSISKLSPEERALGSKNDGLNVNKGQIEDDDNDNNNQIPNEKMKLTRYPKLKLKRIKAIAAMLKDIDFFNRLNQIHNARLEEFKSFSKDEFYLPQSEFKETFINEPISLAPPVVIANYLFNPNTPIDEFGHQKSFFESIFLDRKDTDLVLDIDKDNNEIPLFFSDLDYNLSLFGDFDRNELETFLLDIPNWAKVSKYRIQLVHPIKKYFIGPDKVSLDDRYYVYYISPKCLVVDDLSYGFGFPFSDTFVSITQYRFHIDYEFNERKGRFQFKTKCTISFLVKFVKSCIFAGKIAESGYETACEGIKFYMFEKIKIVIDNQSNIFNDMLNKLSDDTIQRKVICEKEANDDEDIEENDDDFEAENNCDDDNREAEEAEIQFQPQAIDNKLDPVNGKKKGINFSSKRLNILLIGISGIIVLICLKYYFSNDPNKSNWILSVILCKIIHSVKQLTFLITFDNLINLTIVLMIIWIIMNFK